MSGEGNDDGREMRKEGRRGSIKRRRKKISQGKGRSQRKEEDKRVKDKEAVEGREGRCGGEE